MDEEFYPAPDLANSHGDDDLRDYAEEAYNRQYMAEENEAELAEETQSLREALHNLIEKFASDNGVIRKSIVAVMLQDILVKS